MGGERGERNGHGGRRGGRGPCYCTRCPVNAAKCPGFTGRSGGPGGATRLLQYIPATASAAGLGIGQAR
ncbi:hypothetical protein L665_00536 [Ralstonia solanacearum SD54]|nr:hypothetical protein L665_00536 [Ralstonia solanacearum SD54]